MYNHEVWHRLRRHTSYVVPELLTCGCIAEHGAFASRRPQLNAKKTVVWLSIHFTENRGLQYLAVNRLRSNPVGSNGSWCRGDSRLRIVHEILRREHYCSQLLSSVRRLRQLRRFVDSEVTARLVLAIVMTRWGYYIPVFADLPDSTAAPLQ